MSQHVVSRVRIRLSVTLGLVLVSLVQICLILDDWKLKCCKVDGAAVMLFDGSNWLESCTDLLVFCVCIYNIEFFRSLVNHRLSK